MKKQLISIFLVLIIVVTLFPSLPSASAEPNTEITQTGGSEGNTIILPIDGDSTTRDQEDEAGLFVLQDVDAIYMPRNTSSFTVTGLILPDGVYSNVARFQLIDESQNLIATSDGQNFYTYTNVNDEIVMGNNELYFLENPATGSYTFQVVDGTAVSPVVSAVMSATAVVVDAPFVTGGYITGLTEGTGKFSVRIDFSNFKGTPDEYALSLFDSDLNEIAVEAENSDIDIYNEVVQVSYTLIPGTAINAFEEYSLGITYNGGGDLYSIANSIDTTATEAGLLSITAVEADDAMIGGIRIYTENTDAASTYNIMVSDDNGYIYYTGGLSPDINGTFAVTLMKNGLVLPLSAYQHLNFTVEVSDGNVTDNYYAHLSGFISYNSYSSLELTATEDSLEYTFMLTGQNILLDLYENPDLSIALKKYQTGSGYQTVGGLSGVIERRVTHTSYTDNYILSGTLVTTETLDSTTYYYIYVNNERITGARASINNNELSFHGVNVTNLEYNNDTRTYSFWFNYGIMPVSAQLSGSSGTAKAQLIDSSGVVISESPETAGIYISEGVYEYEFEIPSSSNITTNDSYSVIFVEGERSSDEYFSNIVYDDTIVIPDNLHVNGSVLVGDMGIEISHYAYGTKNITTDMLASVLPSFTRVATSDVIQCSDYSVQQSAGQAYISLSFNTALQYGLYAPSVSVTIQNGNSIYVKDAGTPTLGTLCSYYNDDEVVGTYFCDCLNLPIEGSYLGRLYFYDKGDSLVSEDLTLSPSANGTVLMVNNMPIDLTGGSYTLAVWHNDTLIGEDSFYIQPDESTETGKIIFITGYYLEYNELSGYYSRENIDYSTPTPEISFDAYLSGYAYVRFAEADISSAVYRPIRDNMDYSLSDGEGEKTIYVQFQKTDGTESSVYSYTCSVSENDESIEIVSASMDPEYIVPDNTEITVTLVSSSRLCDVYGELLYSDNGLEEVYYNAYPFDYIGPCEGGYEFRLTLNSSDSPLSYSFYDWTGIRCYVEAIDGSATVTQDIPMHRGALDEIYFNNLESYPDVYTNQTGFIINGYATANATVTVTYSEYGNTSNTGTVQTLTGPDYTFSAVLPDSLAEGRYLITASDTSGLASSGSYYLILDKTAPVITDLSASIGESGNAVVSWEADSDDVAYYLLWRNNAPIKTASNQYTNTSYIDVGGTDSAVYKVVAVDYAGNQSAPVSADIGDIIPPSQPGAAVMTSRGTKSISITWTQSTDNFAVARYDIFRDGSEEPIAILDATAGDFVSAYTDNDLVEGTEYTYVITASDAAGNVSEVSSASTLSTAILTAEARTVFDEFSFRQQGEIQLSVWVDKAEMYDTDHLTVLFEYKTASDEQWISLPLDLDPEALEYSQYEAVWDISGMAIGTYDLKFTVTDADETIRTVGEANTVITDDNIAPEITMNMPIANSTHGVNREITISGSSDDNIAVDHVQVSYCTEGANYTEITELTPEEVGVGSYDYSFDWVAAGASGDVTVRATAYDTSGNSAYVEHQINIDAQAPNDVDNFSVTGTSSYIYVNWSYETLSVDNDFDAFLVYRATTVDGPFAIVSRQATLGYYDDGKDIQAGTTYHYYVSAIDDYGNESNGSPVLSAELATDTESPTIGDMIPRDGASLCKTTTLSVTAADNYRLSKVVFEYRLFGSSTWTMIASVPVEEITNNTTFSYTWDISSMLPGTYEVKASVYDNSVEIEGVQTNPPATLTRTVQVKAYTTPAAPSLTTQSSYKAIALRWIYAGDASLLASFKIYRSNSESGEYLLIKTLSATTRSYTSAVPIGTTYYYKVVAADMYGAKAESNTVSGESSGGDAEAPIAVISPDSLIAAVGVAFQFSAVNSIDNDVITSWQWAFGDGTDSSEKMPKHIFTASGEYTVTLTVTDDYGNTDTETAAITVVDVAAEDAIYSLVTLTVVDASLEETPVIPGVEISISSSVSGSIDTTAVTDDYGVATVLLRRGIHTVSTNAEGYLPRTLTLSVLYNESGTLASTIGMSKVALVTGELTSEEMTLEEITAAGIDTNDPDNQHVWKFKTVFQFTVGLKTYDLPVTVGYRNNAGTFTNAPGGWHLPDTLGGLKLGVFPMITEGFYLVVYGEAHWLKEMYNVELVVINNSYTDDIVDCTAELALPEGLTLAKMLGIEQSDIIDIGTIYNAGTIDNVKKATWYVKGDNEGEYYLSANVNGEFRSSGVSEPFEATFTTDTPVKVYAGSALKLTITADDIAERGEDYTVKFRITNVSDKILNNLSFGISGVEQYKVLRIGTAEGDLPIDSYDFSSSTIQGINELAPGGYVELEMSTTIWFNSALELVEMTKFGTFVDIAYYLANVSIVTLEGSTTEIPYEINLNRVEREQLIDKIINDIVDVLYGDDLPGGSLSGCLVEVIGEVTGIFIPKAKEILNFLQSETDHRFVISIDDGMGNDDSIYNDIVSITTGSGTQGVIDTLNGTKLTFEYGEISFQAKGSGSTTIRIGVEDSLGNLKREYAFNITINDTELTNKITLIPDSISGEFTLNENSLNIELANKRQEEESVFKENPFLWFDSSLVLDVNASDADSRAHINMSADSLNAILDETATTILTMDGRVADLDFTREALNEITQQVHTIDPNANISFLMEKLSDEDAAELGSDRTTYKFLIEVNESKIIDFGTSSVYISLPYTLREGENGDDIYIERVRENGETEMVDAYYNNETGEVTFTTDEFSYYRICCSETNNIGSVQISDLQNGTDTIAVPESGIREVVFGAVVLDSDGLAMPIPNDSIWSVHGDDMSGLSIEDGVLSIASNAIAGMYTVRFSIDDSLYDEKMIMLLSQEPTPNGWLTINGADIDYDIVSGTLNVVITAANEDDHFRPITLVVAAYDTNSRLLDMQMLGRIGINAHGTYSDNVSLGCGQDAEKITLKLFAVNDLQSYKPITEPWIFLTTSDPDENPVIITNAEQLANIRNDPYGDYILGSNIDLSTYNNGIWNPIPYFYGSLDGGGYVIQNLDFSITTTSNVNAGLFGVLQGTVSNLGLELSSNGVNVTTTQSAEVGGIAGSINSGSIENCFVRGDITVSASNTFTGGIVGNVAPTASILQCFTMGSFSMSINTSGGIGDMGGIAGYCFGEIINSYTIANISANNGISNAGGLVGCTNGGTISYCYTSSTITTSGAGGVFIGLVANNTTVLSGYYDNSACNLDATYTGALTGVSAKSSSALKTQDTFVDWDFENVWNISASINNGFPFLKYWESS